MQEGYYRGKCSGSGDLVADTREFALTEHSTGQHRAAQGSKAQLGTTHDPRIRLPVRVTAQPPAQMLVTVWNTNMYKVPSAGPLGKVISNARTFFPVGSILLNPSVHVVMPVLCIAALQQPWRLVRLLGARSVVTAVHQRPDWTRSPTSCKHTLWVVGGLPVYNCCGRLGRGVSAVRCAAATDG